MIEGPADAAAAVGALDADTGRAVWSAWVAWLDRQAHRLPPDADLIAQLRAAYIAGWAGGASHVARRVADTLAIDVTAAAAGESPPGTTGPGEESPA